MKNIANIATNNFPTTAAGSKFFFFADLNLRKGRGDYESDLVIPGYQKVIFDEAHHLEDVASKHLGSEVSRRGMLQVLGRLLTPRKKRGRQGGRLPWLESQLAKHHKGEVHELLGMKVKNL